MMQKEDTMALKKINYHDMKELLNKGWMTHDAMWFVGVYMNYGIEKANELNLAAIDGMGAIEARRMHRAAGYDKGQRFESFDEFYEFFEWIFSILKPDFMDFEFEKAENSTIRFRWNTCFAHRGMVRLGAIEGYRCGIVHRIKAWLRTLEVQFTLHPGFEGCIMHENGFCEGEFILSFD